jgi:hypothetical protein
MTSPLKWTPGIGPALLAALLFGASTPAGQVAGRRHFARTPRGAALRGVWPGAGSVAADPSAAATRTGCGGVAAAARHSLAGGRGVVRRRAWAGAADGGFDEHAGWIEQSETHRHE